MNSQRARDKAINLMSEEAKELTVEFSNESTGNSRLQYSAQNSIPAQFQFFCECCYIQP